MNCSEFARVFYADLAEASAGGEETRAAADRHAAGCARCARILAQQGTLASAMGVALPRTRRARNAARARRRAVMAASLVALVAIAGAVARGAGPRLVALLTPGPHAHAPVRIEPTRSAGEAPPGTRGAPIAADVLAHVRSEAIARDLAAANEARASSAPSAPPPGSFEAAMLVFRSGRHKTAALAFQAVTPPTPEAAFWSARSHRASGDFPGAAFLFDEIAAAQTRSTVGEDALLEAGRCYRAIGNVNAARDRLRPLHGSATHAARAQEELDGIERDLGLAKKRAMRLQALESAPAQAPLQRGIAPTGYGSDNLE